jgi:hypothetical protein
MHATSSKAGGKQESHPVNTDSMAHLIHDHLLHTFAVSFSSSDQHFVMLEYGVVPQLINEFASSSPSSGCVRSCVTMACDTGIGRQKTASAWRIGVTDVT